MRKLLLIGVIAIGLNTFGQNQPVYTNDLIGVVVSSFSPRAHIWLSKTEQSNFKLHYTGRNQGFDSKYIELTINNEEELLELEELFYSLLKSKDTVPLVIDSNLESLFSISYKSQGITIQSKKDGENWFGVEPITGADDIENLFGRSLRKFNCSCDYTVVTEKDNIQEINAMGSIIIDTASFKVVHEARDWCLSLIKTFQKSPSDVNVNKPITADQKIIFDFDKPGLSSELFFKRAEKIFQFHYKM